MPEAAERLFVALDVDRLEQAEALLDRLAGIVGGCKIGSQLFTAAGPLAIERALKRGYRVFLDLKYHDIPNTVAGAVREATRLGVFMLNVHGSGGGAMMRAAVEAATKAAKEFALPRPLVLGVTVLTSLDRRGLEREVGVLGRCRRTCCGWRSARGRPGWTAAWPQRGRSRRCVLRWDNAG